MTTTTNARTATTLADALSTYSAHTAADRATADALVTAAGAVAAYRTPSRNYVGYVNAAGATVAYLHLGYVTVLDSAAQRPARDLQAGRPMVATGHESQGWDVYLSTYTAGNGSGQAGQALRTGAPCPTCWETLPLAGECFNCA